MNVRRNGIALAVVLAAAPLVPRAAPEPLAVEGPWRALTTDHFVLLTDLDRESALAALDELELLRKTLLESMFDREVPSPERIEVVAFVNRPEFLEVTGRESLDGYFQHSALSNRRRIVLSGGLETPFGEVAAHELVHYLSQGFVPYQPRWLSEGLATYFETVGRGTGAERRAGTIPDRALLGWLRQGLLPTKDLLAWRGSKGRDEPRYYATSWLLVHYLMNAERGAFGTYQLLLAHGEAPRVAWNTAFPDYSLDAPKGTKKLDDRLKDHTRSRDWTYLPVEATVDVTVDERVLASSEVHALKLELGSRQVGSKWLRQEAEAGLREDPNHLRALAVLAQEEPARALALGRRAVAAHPTDPDAWLILAEASRGPQALPAREEALRRAMELGPLRVDTRLKLALELFESGRDAEAEAEAREAVRLAPWEVAPLRAQALALVALSRCDESVVALGRAADLAPESLGSTEARETTKLLSDLEARCRDDRLREADVLGARAVLAIRRHDAGTALRFLREAVDRDPDNLLALAELPGVERNLGHLEDATRFGVRYLSLAPEDPTFRSFFASIHRERGNFGLAEKALREQISRFPKDEWARMYLVDLLFETNRPSQARKELQAFSQTAAPASAVSLARARLGLLTGSDPGAAAMLKRAVMAEPHAFVETAAATAFAEAGVELETAAEWAQQARAELTAIAADAPLDAIGPDHADAGAQLLAVWGVAGRIAARRGQLAEAEALLDAAERAGAGPEISAFLAETLAAAGRAEEAIQAAQRALAASPGQRLALRLAGPGGAAGGGDALAALRTLPLPGVTDLPARDLLVALGKDGKVLRIVSRDALPHSSALNALIGTTHGIGFPEDAPPFLVVPATVHCEASRCGVLLGRGRRSIHGA